MGLVAPRAADASGWVCCSAPRVGAAPGAAEAGADLELSLSKMSVDIRGVSSVYSGTRRFGI